MNISSTSPWAQNAIDEFLESAVIPIRISVQDGDFPLICSVWFVYDESRQSLLCASHESSYLVKLLKQTPRCAFEIAPNEPPYCGVRGKADVELHRDNIDSLLPNLIERYLGDTSSKLASWLLGRIEQELVLELKPRWITAWDYSDRM